LLGDRIRMNAISHGRAYMRSLATRDDNTALSAHVQDAIDICKSTGFDLVILESAGVGQSDVSVLDYCDVSLYVMTPEYGAASQLEKINMLDYADVVCINKFDKAGALDALHDVRKQYKRNHSLWNAKDEELPIVGTIAAQFNDAGVNDLFEKLFDTIEKKCRFFQTYILRKQRNKRRVHHHKITDHSAETRTLLIRNFGEQQEL
jgi:methylmalonyl-CoA mutase